MYSMQIWDANKALSAANLMHTDSQYTEIISELSNHIIDGHPEVYRTKDDMDSYFWHSGNDGHESGLNVDTVQGIEAADIIGGVDPGIMVWWYPENGNVPSGFLFCNGDNGTMDMRLRYPIGASATISVNQAAGNSAIIPLASATIGACTLTVSNIYHTHQGQDDYDSVYNQDINGYSNCAHDVHNDTRNTSSFGGGGSHTHPGTFTGDSKAIDPLFKYLVIIQKS